MKAMGSQLMNRIHWQLSVLALAATCLALAPAAAWAYVDGHHGGGRAGAA